MKFFTPTEESSEDPKWRFHCSVAIPTDFPAEAKTQILPLEKYYRCKSTIKYRHQHRIHQIAKTQYIHQIAQTYINTEQQNQSRNLNGQTST